MEKGRGGGKVTSSEVHGTPGRRRPDTVPLRCDGPSSGSCQTTGTSGLDDRRSPESRSQLVFGTLPRGGVSIGQGRVVRSNVCSGDKRDLPYVLRVGHPHVSRRDTGVLHKGGEGHRSVWTPTPGHREVVPFPSSRGPCRTLTRPTNRRRSFLRRTRPYNPGS